MMSDQGTSQSLRKSGQFLPFVCVCIGGNGASRNPFVSQVNFFQITELFTKIIEVSRNPFVSQVNFFTNKQVNKRVYALRRNPFVSQVNFFNNSVKIIETKGEDKSQSLRKSGQFLPFGTGLTTM